MARQHSPRCAGGGRRHSLGWLKLVIPRDALEKRMLATVAVVRLLVLPFFNMLVVTALVRVSVRRHVQDVLHRCRGRAPSPAGAGCPCAWGSSLE